MNFRYRWIKRVLYTEGVTPLEKVLLVHLSMIAIDESGLVFFSYTRAGRLIGHNKNAIRRAVISLAKKGLIDLKKGRCGFDRHVRIIIKLLPKNWKVSDEGMEILKEIEVENYYAKMEMEIER